jgi:hypothetical protein
MRTRPLTVFILFALGFAPKGIWSRALAQPGDSASAREISAMTTEAGSETPPATGDDSLRARDLQDFDFLVEKITANYAGYPTKVTDANRDSLATSPKARHRPTWIA